MNFWTFLICFWIVMLGAVMVELVWKWRQEETPTDIEQAPEEGVAITLAEKPEVEPREEMPQLFEHAVPEVRA